MPIRMIFFWQLIFCVSAVITLVVPGGHFAGPFFMALAGLFYRQQAQQRVPLTDPVLQASWTWLLAGFGVMVITGIGLSLWHPTHAGHYEMYIPFVLFPAVAWLIRAGRWRAEPWLLCLSAGALLAFFYAAYQVFALNIARAYGTTNHPIPFGNTAIVLSAVALVSGAMFPFEGPHAQKKRLFVCVAGVAGAGASLLSGSRGGWLSLFIVGFTVAYLATRHWPAWRRHLCAAAVMASLVLAGLLAPSHLVKDRLVTGFQGGIQWLKTGEVSDGSVGMRMEIWRLSLQVISEKPWFGHGSVGAHGRWEELRNEPTSSPMLSQLYEPDTKFVSFDNEWLGTLAGGGVVGALAALTAYLGVWLAFWRWRSHADLQIKTLATIGLLLPPIYMEFGLTVSVFGTNVFRSVFVMLSVSLLALMAVRFNALKEAP